MTTTIQQVINHTNERLSNWYKEAKEYGINGGAIAFLHNSQIVIDYSENGVNARFILDQWQNESIDYVFNVWSEDADLENDKVY